MKKLVFYTKLDCHLCDEAIHLLLDLICEIPMAVEIVDIALPHHRGSYDRFTERIPVITRPDAETELAWPFTSDDLRAYLLSSHKTPDALEAASPQSVP